VLLDPQAMSSDGRRYAITYLSPSPDGKYVAYGAAPGGTEDAELRVIETATGRDLGERIDRTRLGNPTWLPDGRSFFYHRLQALPPGAPPAQRYLNARVFLHTLGQDPEQDTPVFGANLSPAVVIDPALHTYVRTIPGSSHVFGYVRAGAVQTQIYAAPVDSVRQTPVPWRLVADIADQVTSLAVHGDDLYVLTSRDAPRRRILRTSLTRPDFAAAQVIVPAAEAVITSMHAAEDGLYLLTLDGGIRRLLRLDWKGGPPQAVPLPFEASVSIVDSNPLEPGVVFRTESWTVSPAWLAYDRSRTAAVDTRLLPPSPVDFSGITSTQVRVRSHDGTMIPLTIVWKRGLKRDGRNPTLLLGYGAYGTTTSPSFRPRMLAWLEQGGVWAYAHVRGGGDYGAEWHSAGQKLTKMNSVRDFIACAEYLIREKYSSPVHLAGQGESAGGIVVGRAITERPDLFGAAVTLNAVLNPLRLETEPGGLPSVPEFGSVKTAEGFEGLAAMDAYHHVKDRTAYPAVLLITGAEDARVSPAQSAKMAARLQAATTSGKPVLLRVDYAAGHAFSTQRQRIEELADTYAFLLWQLRASASSQ
jgi:prolyl oligopeptidase